MSHESSAARRRALALIVIAELFAMSLWFSGTAVLPQLGPRWQGSTQASWLTIAVQLGFASGGLFSALLNLSDRIPPVRLFAICTLAAAAVNAGFALVADEALTFALFLRAATGFFLAGVYPVGMKLVTGWYQSGRGLALGALVGALTTGAALPHGLRAFGPLPWRELVLTCSALSLVGALLILFVSHGPFQAPSPPLDLKQIGRVLAEPRLRLVNLAYLGHMWELYAFWGWLGTVLAASARGMATGSQVALWTALSIASGSMGCVLAGWLADRGGATVAGRVRRRSLVAGGAMLLSGACCIGAAFLFPSFALLSVLCLVWGCTVIADSAQFSALVSELSDRRYVGTALTMQTTLGFVLTALSIRVTGALAAGMGWRTTVAMLAIGPAIGCAALLRLCSVYSPRD